MRRTTLVTLCLASTAVLTACGSPAGEDTESAGTGSATARAGSPRAAGSGEPFPGMSARQILMKAQEATLGAPSLHFKGTMTEGGQHIGLDITRDDRRNCVGSMTMEGIGTTEFIMNSQALYRKYDDKMLRAQAEKEPENARTADALRGNWVKSRAKGDDAKKLRVVCDFPLTFSDLAGESPRRGTKTSVGGKPAYSLTILDGVNRATFHVSSEGEPGLLRVETAVTGVGEFDLAFAVSDRPVRAGAPADQKIIDVSRSGS
ncbi:hypothetical protein ACIBCB_19100 [Streptomyces uncialis]|uniref:hypothetical protein n=1 Tax=Streptomyces uncialis TaxID=1048205 RepID=UPI0022559D65|nr:hypothetical protein [Streptomyces uncialis]MCX4660735.1 hypothetical protein [Streptomyces uncialis]WST68730.1 hypothetical protein OG268_15210 [Streptomyces uncialis]